MKKSLIALAVMAAAGAASAQSSVTLFGIVDAAISNQRVSNGGGSNTILTNSGYNSSRLGFRGTEDLGGGMAASFWLEGQLTNDDGTVGKFDFRRRSTVSLSGGWGEVRLGRDYTPTFWNGTLFDPFGTNGVGQNIVGKVKGSANVLGFNVAAADPKYVRSDNMVQYFLPANLGGLYGQLSYAFDETPTGVTPGDVGRYLGARLGFGSGPFNVAIAYGRTEGAETVASPDVRDLNIGGSWDFGVARAMAYYDRAKYETNGLGDATLKSWLVGALVPVGAGEIRASYGRAKFDDGGPSANQWALGYVHNLSKRTALYATYARLKNEDGMSLSIGSAVAGQVNTSTSGFDLGIRHSF